MHKNHVVNNLNGLSDFTSVRTFNALLIESWDVYSECELQIMHFTTESWDVYSEYDLQIMHFTTEPWDVYFEYDLQIMHFTEVILG